MSAERRLSELTAALSSATATLDDVARTRIASRLLAQLDAPVIARRPRRWRGPLVAAIGVAA
ncbi:MAG: hypothetical protein K8W52_25740, partial [Deltaproteobacteria bacterium]|nr:hypothetical protein [Deltaproteobacteria bacterium]